MTDGLIRQFNQGQCKALERFQKSLCGGALGFSFGISSIKASKSLLIALQVLPNNIFNEG